jgi:shikimate dehydrogenase
VAGFVRALEVEGQVDARGKEVLLAGAGGSARAVVVALIDAGAARVRIIGRTLERAVRLAGSLREAETKTELDVLADTRENWAKAAAIADVLVNCTPLGMAGGGEEDRSPISAELIRPEMLVYDLVYRPIETPLLRDARARGARALGGLPMLVYQGAASFKIWTHREAPIDVMMAAAREALGVAEPEAETA